MVSISRRQVSTFASAGILRDRLTIGRGVVALDDVEIMRLAEQSGVQEGELFAGRQLTRASVAREAGQMINPFPGPSHPIAGAHAASAFRALCAESSANTNKCGTTRCEQQVYKYGVREPTRRRLCEGRER